MFSNASNFVEGVDISFAVILGISVFFLVAITAVMIWFVIRYNRKRNPKPGKEKENYKLEVIWTVIPTLLVLVMFYYLIFFISKLMGYNEVLPPWLAFRWRMSRMAALSRPRKEMPWWW